MAISPKYRPGMPPRFPSGSRRYSKRQLGVLLAFVLLVTSGSMLVYHIAAGSSSRTKTGCNKDADFAVIRWNTRPRDSSPPLENSNNWERPRVALPHHEGEQNPEQQQQEQQEQQRQEPYPPHPQLQEEQNEQLSNDLNQDINDQAIDETITEEEDYVPFQDTLDQDDGEKYISYLPYAGITNQFYGMLRGMEVAKALGRTLILPPITASSHDKSKQNQPWSKFLDLERFSEITGTKVVEFHQLRDAEMAEYNQLDCKITCGFGSKRTIDFTAKGFLKQWHFNVTLSPLRTDANKLNTIVSVLEPYRRDKFICISNTYKISVADKSEWERFGQHLHFTEELTDFVQEFLDKNLIATEPVYDSKSGQMTKPEYRYITIHARRGDFAEYCANNFAGPKLIHCLPSTEQFAERIDKVQQRLTPALASSSTSALAEMLPVFVATNERRPEELKKFADLGWRYLDHEEMRTAEKLGVFGPMMIDQVLISNAAAAVGIQMSTFSRVGALRLRDWHHRSMDYM
ncbi:hypothetical protein BGZ52_007188 [Haplosporangium bisporale]|nr:hypothetical protein BGZ52_007188 [Haplosporangium bisporale]KAF9204802.1 hypothetical protein BGZ59_000859 [Podila verticillata]KFH71952.1 hypothetical protein MVEG_02246 [Podila verticillata NRRL 6337]